MTDDPTPEVPVDPEADESRWKRYEATVRERLDTATQAAEARRENSRLYDMAFLVLERNKLLPASLLVGALASRIVIYLVPLFALLVFAFGVYGDLADVSAGEAIRQAGMVSLFATAVNEATGLSGGFRVVALFATAYAALYAANSLGRLVRRSTALVWGVSYVKVDRPLMIPVAVVALTLIAWLLSSLSTITDDWTPAAFVGAVVTEIAAMSLFWLLVSRILPHDPTVRPIADLLPGAIFVGLSVVALRVALVVYFAPAVDTLSARYGSIALGLIMLTWAYWLGMIMVGSAEINAALFRSRQRRLTP